MHFVLSLFLASFFVYCVCGHGMMLDPPNRSSVWRFNRSAEPNYSDNQVFCGGFYVQNYQNGGKCGVCGDNWSDPHPQENENTGKYGREMVVKSYTSGQVIDVKILLTMNHRGTFRYSLCDLQNPHAPEPENCFSDLRLEDGTLDYPVKQGESEIYNRVKLPDGVRCDRCVLRWTYRTGNNWGDCGDGRGALGCGPQEHFRNCADITIY